MLKHLSLSQKISLLFILCITPTLLLLTLFLKEVNSDILFSTKEKIGAEIISNLITTKKNLLLLNIKLSLQENNTVDLEKNLEDSFENLGKIDTETTKILALRSEDLASRKLDAIEPNRIIAEWEKYSKEANTIDKRNQVQSLSQNINSLIEYVANSSNLLLDPDLDSFHLMDAFALTLPKILNLLSDSISKLSSNTQKNKPLSEHAISEELLDQSIKSIENAVKKSLQENSLSANKDTFLQTKLSEEMTPLLASLYEINRIQHPYMNQDILKKFENSLLNMDKGLLGLKTAFTNLLETRISHKQSKKFGGTALILFACLSIFCCGIYLLRKWLYQIESNFELLRNITQHLHNSSEKLQVSASKSAAAASQEAAAIQETVAAMTEMNSMLKQSSNHTESASHLARQTFEVAEKGKQTMEEMSTSIDNIAHANLRLKEITKVIEDIAARTNIINDIVFKTQLLAVNASIEAARAGHHGKGFAVVANEVGNLASLSGKAAFEIRELLDESKQKVSGIINNTAESVEQGKNVSQMAVGTFNSVLDSIEQINNKVQQIFEATKEQELGIKQSSQAMNEMNHATVSNNGLAQDNSKLSTQIKEHADQLELLQLNFNKILKGSKKSPSKEAQKKSRLSRMDEILLAMDSTEIDSPKINSEPDKMSNPISYQSESDDFTKNTDEPSIQIHVKDEAPSEKLSLAAKLSAKLSSRQGENSIASLSDLKLDKTISKTQLQSRFEWNQNYDIGVDAMNGEHKKLLKLMKDLETAFYEKQSEREQLAILKELAEYTIKHFSDEEQYLASIHYPELEPHKMIHANLLNKLSSYAEKFESQGFIEESFFSFLKTWLSAHIQGVDMKYGNYSKTIKKVA